MVGLMVAAVGASERTLGTEFIRLATLHGRSPPDRWLSSRLCEASRRIIAADGRDRWSVRVIDRSERSEPSSAGWPRIAALRERKERESGFREVLEVRDSRTANPHPHAEGPVKFPAGWGLVS